MRWFKHVAATWAASLILTSAAQGSQPSAQMPARSVAITYDDLPFVFSTSEEPTLARARALKAN